MRSASCLSALAVLSAAAALALPASADETARAIVDAAIEPVIEANGIPGLSVAVLVDGERHVFHYGVASRETGAPVGDDTIFEIGSLSKPFTGTLGARLAAEGRLDLTAEARSLMPELDGSDIGRASLLDLATYTAGGLPLQFPDGVDDTNFAAWYRDFPVTAPAGASRLYSNPSIGLFGHLATAGAGEDFADLLRTDVLQPLNLSDTFLNVPAERMGDYAQGYNREDAPVRVNPGLFDREAYGVKTTANDLLSFVEASFDDASTQGALAQGLVGARSGYYRVGAMHQGLGWELYGAPARVADLLQGTDSGFVLEPNAVEPVAAPMRDRSKVGTVSKTGSTGGFGAYALFSPERGTGIVILANRFWPNPARVETAHAILSELDPGFFAR